MSTSLTLYMQREDRRPTGRETAVNLGQYWQTRVGYLYFRRPNVPV